MTDITPKRTSSKTPSDSPSPVREAEHAVGLSENDKLKAHIGDNLARLIRSLGLSQREFAEKIDVAPSALNEYIKRKSIPSIAVISRICNNRSLNLSGFTMQDFVSTEVDFPDASTCPPPEMQAEPQQTDCPDHMDFVGSYIMCFINTSLPFDLSESSPGLKYGVLCIYRNSDVGATEPFNAFLRVCVDYEDARSFIIGLDTALGKNRGGIVGVRRAIYDYSRFSQDSRENDMFYNGTVSFASAQSSHMFINLSNAALGDDASLIFHVPPKRHSSDYIGGIGISASVSRGLNHLPMAQKIIISSGLFDRFDTGERIITCDETVREEILLDLLLLDDRTVELTTEAEELAAFCKRLTAEKSELLSEDDKLALISNRIRRLVAAYFRTHSRSVSAITLQEDQTVYKVLKRFSPSDTASEDRN